MGNRDYNREMKGIISTISEEKKPKLLLHCCCGPCSTAVIERLASFDVTLFYYNPNTWPGSEYYKRLDTLREYIQKAGIDTDIISCEYDSREYLQEVASFTDTKEGGERCRACIALRLTKTAQYAKEHGYMYFASTLSVSPMKNANMINDIGEQLEKEYCVKYLVNNFKKDNGYVRSLELSREYGLYRQNYCGCEASSKKREL